MMWFTLYPVLSRENGAVNNNLGARAVSMPVYMFETVHGQAFSSSKREIILRHKIITTIIKN